MDKAPLAALLTRARERLTRCGDPHDEDLIAALADAARDVASAFTGEGAQMVLAVPGRELERRVDVLRDALRALDGKDGGR